MSIYKNITVHNPVTLCPIVQTANPKIGSTLTKTLNCNGEPCKVLFDTGSPTSLIRTDVDQKLKLKLAAAPPFEFRGMVSAEKAATKEAAKVNIAAGNTAIKLAAYVTDAMPHDIIVGNPVIDEYKDVIYNLRSDTDLGSLTCPDYELNAINMTDINDMTDITESTENKNDIVFATNITASEKENDGFANLPVGLQEKYKITVRNDLPPKTSNKNTIVEHEIEIKEDSRLPRFQPYHTTPKLEKEITLIVDDLL
ncbi:uncharacterized protein NDAI_0B01150 [Naumovozyma dairenensis CBS 421]|uniref:Peptidase A2B Ty3 transposon peptidase domain-containing protein n=1 Tax=Naumovozyma dairenensis (strain ATCC 10597 / BCRC 20456 / CBS 421 / NBRC 0211 / NRRL Y-12639) TaxID=1071378 RepID=G0W5T8_NAUDC|nr:hypothetical protein NDAI_0B01150 [Naumovozyma dairenensis CBS 421]CCD23149.1 hypothetical protein NDAI_0B01150 [Naumovozyma dairenensis CBS 421]